jgi:hypothetical protein
LRVSITVPDLADTTKRLVFVIAGAGGHDWKVRSAPFQISATKL